MKWFYYFFVKIANLSLLHGTLNNVMWDCYLGGIGIEHADESLNKIDATDQILQTKWEHTGFLSLYIARAFNFETYNDLLRFGPLFATQFWTKRGLE